MKPVSELTKEDIADLKIICFDVDGVTVKRGTQIEEVKGEEVTTLTVKTANLSESVLKKMLELKKHFFLAVASGRSSLYLTKIYKELLWENIALLSENGIFTLIEGELVQHEKFEQTTLTVMRNIFVGLQKLEGKDKNFRAFEPKQFLITLHAYEEMKEVYEIVKRNDLKDEFYCWWNGEAFDIAPKRLNKGIGLINLARHLGIDIKDTMAIGNGPNDKDMVDAAGIGVTTDPKVLPSDFFTTSSLHLGGEELIDKLLSLVK